MNVVVEESVIAAGEKFAMIAIPKANASGVADSTSLGNRCWAMRSLPLELAEHWRNWIGEIKVRQITEAGFYLLATSTTAQPSVLDGDNQRLMRQVAALWDGLLITHTPHAATAPVLVTGAHIDGSPNVRQISELRQPVRLAFNTDEVLRSIKQTDLNFAVLFAEVLTNLASGQDHERLKRAVSAFFAGVHEHRPDERLHQFCRCVDGLILSGKGRGEADFVSRTADFIGDGKDDMLREIYRMRSAVEHLRPAESEAAGVSSLRDQRLRLLTRSVQAERIARQAVQRVLGSVDLFAAFENDNSLQAFWSLPSADRRSQLQAPVGFDATLHNLIDPQLISDEDIGITAAKP